MNRAEKDERPLLVPAGDSLRGAKGASMLSGDYKQRAIYIQWVRDYLKGQISQANATISDLMNTRPGLSAEESISLFLMSQPLIPDDARELTEQIFRWDITAIQFIAIQKTLALPLHIAWGQKDGRIGAFDVYIGKKEIELVEKKFPELEKSASRCRKYIEAWEIINHEANFYELAYGFWGRAPREIKMLWHTGKRLFYRLSKTRAIDPMPDTPAPPRGGLPRYVESLYAEGKTAQEIATILQGKGLSRAQIGVLLREGDDIIGDYGKWLDGKGWLSQKPKE